MQSLVKMLKPQWLIMLTLVSVTTNSAFAMTPDSRLREALPLNRLSVPLEIEKVESCDKTLTACDDALKAADRVIEKQKQDIKEKQEVIDKQAEVLSAIKERPFYESPVFLIAVGAVAGGFIVHEVRK